MRPDLDIIKQLIKDEALVTVKEDWRGNKRDKKFFLILKEPVGRKSSGYEIKILNTPKDTIAIKSDMFSLSEKIFKSTKGECKRADFVIIARDGGKNWIIFVEMKRDIRGQGGHIRQQLRGSRCFIDYCRTIGRVFWEEPKFLEEEDYQERYVCVKNIGLDKRPTRESGRLRLHDCPEDMLITEAPRNRLQFKKLSGRRNR